MEEIKSVEKETQRIKIERVYDEFLQFIDPKKHNKLCVNTLTKIADFYMDQKEFEIASNYYDQIAYIDKDNATVYFNIAMCKLKCKNLIDVFASDTLLKDDENYLSARAATFKRTREISFYTQIEKKQALISQHAEYTDAVKRISKRREMKEMLTYPISPVITDLIKKYHVNDAKALESASVEDFEKALILEIICFNLQNNKVDTVEGYIESINKLFAKEEINSGNGFSAIEVLNNEIYIGIACSLARTGSWKTALHNYNARPCSTADGKARVMCEAAEYYANLGKFSAAHKCIAEAKATAPKNNDIFKKYIYINLNATNEMDAILSGDVKTLRYIMNDTKITTASTMYAGKLLNKMKVVAAGSKYRNAVVKLKKSAEKAEKAGDYTSADFQAYKAIQNPNPAVFSSIIFAKANKPNIDLATADISKETVKIVKKKNSKANALVRILYFMLLIGGFVGGYFLSGMLTPPTPKMQTELTVKVMEIAFKVLIISGMYLPATLLFRVFRFFYNKSVTKEMSMIFPPSFNLDFSVTTCSDLGGFSGVLSFIVAFAVVVSGAAVFFNTFTRFMDKSIGLSGIDKKGIMVAATAGNYKQWLFTALFGVIACAVGFIGGKRFSLAVAVVSALIILAALFGEGGYLLFTAVGRTVDGYGMIAAVMAFVLYILLGLLVSIPKYIGLGILLVGAALPFCVYMDYMDEIKDWFYFL